MLIVGVYRLDLEVTRLTLQLSGGQELAGDEQYVCCRPLHLVVGQDIKWIHQIIAP
jgi:hypothetical protein